MINLRHTGVYVRDLARMASFYREVFHMHAICENVEQGDALLADLFGAAGAKVRITKLITEQGKASGVGDMLELLEVIVPDGREKKTNLPIEAGLHIAFGVRDMEATRMAIAAHGGACATRVHDMGNGNLCCFCRDPEGNWLELIARRDAQEEGLSPSR